MSMAEVTTIHDCILPPALDLQLDKDVFKKLVIAFAVGLPLGRTFKKVAEELRDYSLGYVDLPRWKNIYVDSDQFKRKLVLIRQVTEDKDLERLRHLDVHLPESPLEDIAYLETHPNAYCAENCQLVTNDSGVALPSRPCAFRLSIGYENLSFEKALKVVLPKDMDAVTGFSLIGHVAHFNLKAAALPYRKLIGQIAIDKLPNVTTVVNKAAKIDTEFRTFAVDLIAGEPNYLTKVHENGVTFHLDFSQVYWNSRLSTEHSRIVTEIKNFAVSRRTKDPEANIVVYDVFAGVGPFSVPLARVDGCRVLANDLNPASFEFLEENVRSNSSRKHPLTEERIKCSNLDGRDFIRDIVLPHYQAALTTPNHRTPTDFFMLMNLPGVAIDFLDAFRGFSIATDAVEGVSAVALRTRCYCFVRHSLETNGNKSAKAAEADCEAMKRVSEALEIDPEQISTNQEEAKVGDRQSTIRLTQWRVRFVRNTAPLRDMYCLEFSLHFPIADSAKRPKKAVE